MVPGIQNARVACPKDKLESLFLSSPDDNSGKSFWLFPVDDRYDSSDHRHRHRSHAGSMIDDDFDPGCTRTLFVGNIEKTTTFSDLKDAFERYGEIVVSFHKVVSTQNSFLLWLFFVES